LEILQRIDKNSINASSLVGLDNKTEIKLLEINSKLNYEKLLLLNILEKKEFQSFDDSDSKEDKSII